MYSFYLICFLIGGTLMACQFLLGLLGVSHVLDIGGHEVHDLGHDLHDGGHGGDHDHGGAWFTGLLTFRTLVAALTFFGLGGLAGYARFGADNWPLTLAVAVAAGVGALLAVAFLMRSLNQLKADGTALIERAVGQTGTVYLTIPGRKAGVGKVMVCVQERTVEYKAMTPHDELPTGAKVVVAGVLNSDTVEVLPETTSGV